MQNYTQKQGCFIYQIHSASGSDALGVRSSLNVGDDNRVDGTIFYENDLVSVDLICPSRISGSTNGPFLRLTDKSGWLFEKKYGDVVAEEVRVEKGLWAFYVDNVPDGAMLQANPFTRVPKQSYYATKYHPMQLLYFDRRVVSPSSKIASYRVQGTDGWIAESDAQTGDEILLPEYKVKVGMFAYEVSSGSDPISLYKQPSVGPDTKLPVSFASGEIVIVDVIRQSPKNHPYNGPFLRLADGLGWMYEQMGDTTGERMNQLPIEKGCWTFRVMNSPPGIAMRRHPIDRQDIITHTEFNPGDIVSCDRKIKSSSSPTSFYRVTGEDGWVFDLREGGITMMQLISSQPVVPDPVSKMRSWSIEFIRGLALAFDLKEISYNETSRVISYRTDANVRINVYYTTRTVGTALEHPTQGATQFFRRGCSDDELKEIMSNPRVHTGKGYKKLKRNGQINNGNKVEVLEIEEEEYYRNKVIEYEKEEDKITTKKAQALAFLKSIDLKRANNAAKMDSKIHAQTEGFEQKRREEEAAASFSCTRCSRTFNNQRSLNQHKISTRHW